MAKKGTLTVRVISDTKAAERGLTQFGNTVDKTGDRMMAAGKKMTMFATVPIVGAMTLATKSASDLEQAVGGTDAVFKESADTITKYAKTAARDSGLSDRAFREATTGIGGNLKRMGFDVDAAAQKSIELTGVAADLAATYGGTTAEAVDALGAAFRGEADPAERFNLNLKIGAVNAKAVEMGLAESTSSVDDHAKAQALLALVMEQSADAQGQFAREADTTSGQMQIARAEIENAAAEIGANLLPIVSKAAGGVADLAASFANLPEPVQNGVLMLSGLVAIAGPTMTAIGKLQSVAGTAAGAFENLRLRGMYLQDTLGRGGLIGAAGLAGAALVGLTLAVKGHADQAARARERTQSLIDSIQELGAQDGTRKWLNDMVEQNDKVRTAMLEAGVGVDELARALASGGDTWDQFRDSLVGTIDMAEDGAEFAIPRLRNELNGVESSAKNAGITIAQLEAVQSESNDETAEGAEVTEDLGEELEETKSKAQLLDEAVRQLKDGMETLRGAELGADEAAIKVAEDFAALTETLKENGATLDLATAKGRANQSQIIDTIRAAQDHATAVYEETGSLEAATGALEGHVGGLRKDMEQAGFTEEQIAALIDRYNLTPDEIRTHVTLTGVQEAIADINRITQDKVAQIQVQVRNPFTGSTHKLPKSHGGGRAREGAPRLIGRPGHEELFVPDRSGFIHHGIDTDRMRQGGDANSQGRATGLVVNGDINIGSGSSDVVADFDWWARTQRSGV